MKGSFIKANDGLMPIGDDARDILAGLPVGEEVLVEIKLGRSGANHRRFFSFVRMTYDWQERYDNPEVWRGVLLLLGGHFLSVIDKRGNTQLWPKSISFKELDDEQAFRKLFSGVIDGYLASEYARGLSSEQLTMVVQF